MVNNKFEAYKLEREIKRSGVTFTFKRYKLNEYKEPDGEPEEIGAIKGLYHETNSQVTQTLADGSVTRTKKQPALLCLAEDYNELQVDHGDIVEVSDDAPHSLKRTLKFVGAVDIANWGIIVDMSFEMVDHGN